MRHVSRADGGSRKSSIAMEQADTTNSTPHEEDYDAHGGAFAAVAALSAAGRTGDREGCRKGAATDQSSRDKCCAGGVDETTELAELPEFQVRESLHCSICLFLGLL